MNLDQQPIYHLLPPAEPIAYDPFAQLDDDISIVRWPSLEQIGLTKRQVAERQAGLGGSDANIIMSGDGEAILALWRQKRGDENLPDLTDRLPVMLGQWTEDFNRQWFELVDGRRVTAAGLALICPVNPWRRCTLDGMVTEVAAIWEAKHTNAFAKPEDVLERYMPQLHHNMAVAGTHRALLSVIFGNHKFQIFEINSDWSYQIDLLAAEEAFWECVQTGREPVPTAPPVAPKAASVREVCLEGNNEWADAAVDWLGNRLAAKTHAKAVSRLKDLVEEDVSRAFGHGIEAKRSKSGALTIRELAS